MRITDEVYEKVFRPRGVSPEVAEFEDGFYPYEQDQQIPPEAVYTWPDEDDSMRIASPIAKFAVMTLIARYAGRCSRIARRAPGVVMRRFAVPGAESLILAEQRPEWAVYAGNPLGQRRFGGLPSPKTHEKLPNWSRRYHVERDKTRPKHVRQGLSELEFLAVRQRLEDEGIWGVNEGADHRGRDTDRPHVHVDVAKYVFPANDRWEFPDPDGPHRHSEYRTEEGIAMHVESAHGVTGESATHLTEGGEMSFAWVVPPLSTEFWQANRYSTSGLGWLRVVAEMRLPALDQLHEHYVELDMNHFAKRLSWHPYRWEERWRRNRVCFALEGCLKEAALVSHGEATFSCPSVTLWHAPEFESFAVSLRGKLVLVICDSDWERGDEYQDPDAVIRQALMARDALRRLGVKAEVAAPTPEPAYCRLHDKPAGAKRGVDDYLADGGAVDDLVWVRRDARGDLADRLTELRGPGRGRQADGVTRDAAVLAWLSEHASEDGISRASLRTVALDLGLDMSQDEHEQMLRADLPELEDEVLEAQPRAESKVSAVKRSVRWLVEHGVLDEPEPLRSRRGSHLRRRRQNWSGTLQVHEGWRAESRTDLRVRDIR